MPGEFSFLKRHLSQFCRFFSFHLLGEEWARMPQLLFSTLINTDLLLRMVKLTSEKSRSLIQILSKKLIGSDRRLLSTVNKKFLKYVVDAEEQKEAVAVLLTIEVGDYLKTTYNMHIGNLYTNKGNELDFVISKCNSYIVTAISISFDCVNDVNITQMFENWMPLLLGSMVQGIARTTFTGNIGDIPVTINYELCASHIRRDHKKITDCLIACGAQNIVVRGLSFLESVSMIDFSAGYLRIECSENNNNLYSTNAIRAFVRLYLEKINYKSVSLVMQFHKFDIITYTTGLCLFLAKETRSSIEGNYCTLTTPTHRVIFEADVNLHKLSVRIEPFRLTLPVQEHIFLPESPEPELPSSPFVVNDYSSFDLQPDSRNCKTF